jgi:hypothetical protein
MPKKKVLSLAALRAELLRVTDSCPVAKCTPDDCPLCSLARVPRPKRQRWLGALKEDELRYLDTYHRICTRLKEAKSPPLTAPTRPSPRS